MANIEISDDQTISKFDGQTDLEVENENGVYKSDNQDEDKWDNQLQKCWVGYKQVGMKDKNGRMVPNCVPAKKMNKSLWNGTFIK
jgi:hypothetical protein